MIWLMQKKAEQGLKTTAGFGKQALKVSGYLYTPLGLIKAAQNSVNFFKGKSSKKAGKETSPQDGQTDTTKPSRR